MMLNGFTIQYDGRLLSEACGFTAVGGSQVALEDGSVETTTVYRADSGGLEVRKTVATYPGLRVEAHWVEVANTSERDVAVTRVDSMHGIVPRDSYTLRYFESGWGWEFSLQTRQLEGTRILECTAGRSSNGTHPWFTLTGESGSVLTATAAWSGNWIFRFEPAPDGGYRVTGGLSNWAFGKTLKPGETFRAPEVIISALPQGTMDDTSIDLQRLGRRYWRVSNPLKESMPVEWNHWWPYEDALIDEDTFKANVDICAKLGVDVCTLDAGWYGTSAYWYETRGDWNTVNTERFPSGIRALADYTHGKGLKFGIWCEIEAVGVNAEIAAKRPELLALRDSERLGYLCMGNPVTVDWAFGVLSVLIEEYAADWIKLDFNLDPKAGCNRTDHGHGEGDGLFAHYQGYYSLLDRVRAAYPHVILENCSSGGLRIDLGILKHLHFTFLSDPDYSAHALELAWGASTMLHPTACLSWAWSQNRDYFTQNQGTDPIKADMPQSRLDYILRVGMLHQFGFSYRLPEWPAWCLDRLGYHIARYKDVLSRFVRDGDVYRLTEPTSRKGSGDRWVSFLYNLPETKEAALFVFRLPGGEAERIITLKGLDPNATYDTTFEDAGKTTSATGQALTDEGLTFSGLPEEGSEVVILRARR